jgi:chemotaxis protein methyltransferase CheR
MTGTGAALADRLAELLEAQLGLCCVEWQRARLAELAASLALRQRTAQPLSGPALTEEALHLSRQDLQSIIDKVNVGETYFFREPAHFAALLDPVLRERLPKCDPTRPLRILSAGCASGEEAYSIAITLRQYRDDFEDGRIVLLGVDVHAAALEKARRARYSEWALRATPQAVRSECFTQDGDDYRLRDALRKLVRFEEHNLLEPDPDFFRPGSFDVIFCRNVLIYFSERSLRLAVERLTQALVPGGYLFLGHSESLRGITSAVTLCQVGDAFFYRKPESASTPDARAGAHAYAAPLPIGESFIDSIQRSTDRVALLAGERSPPAAPPAPARPVATAAPDEWSALMPVLSQIASEQFGRAQELLAALPEQTRAGTAATLAGAAIACGQGQLEQSRRACQRLLAQAAHPAEAHYLLALCAEQKGDGERARRSYQDAVRVAPRFAMAHLRLGALLRRANLKDAARVALRHAVELLPHEPTARVLLFGGGFRREALVTLCRSELLALGAEP